MTFVSLSGPLWTSLDGLLGRSHDNNQLCFFGFSGEVWHAAGHGVVKLHLDSFCTINFPIS